MTSAGERISIADYARAIHVDNFGVLFWKERPRADFWCEWAYLRHLETQVGRPVPTVENSGYLIVTYKRAKVRAHRLIWALLHGAWPEGDIDHINGDRSDNRPCNLREVSRAINLRNAARRSDNTSGVAGVSRYRGKWRARIYLDGREVRIGTFASYEDAVSARRSAQAQHGYTERHGL